MYPLFLLISLILENGLLTQFMSARLGKLVKHGDILSLSGCIMMRKGYISVLVYILTQLRVVLSKLRQPGGKNLGNI